ncbi:hypothetical protein CRBSH125_33110 [Afipia carboxidovorans]|nr:hypothetical protein CRBSH125_33110 [Afipia carboxidovorans]
MICGQSDHERFLPEFTGMTVRRFDRTDDKRDVELAVPNKSNCLGGSALRDNLLNLRISRAVSATQIGEKAGGDGSV